MKRKYPFVVDKIYHVYNRGVAKNPICNQEADYWRFLQGLCLFNDNDSATNILWRLERNRGRLTLNVLKDYIIKQGENRKPLVKILAYCLMPNHFHLLIEEIQEKGITKFMQKLGLGYARYFNNKYNRVGSLFQDKFKNILVDDENYLQQLLIYINVLNPAEFLEPEWKEEGISDIKKVLDFTEKYNWCTHQEYLYKRNSLIVDRGILGEMFPSQEKYLDLVGSMLIEKKCQKTSDLFID
jgi:putative transposase